MGDVSGPTSKLPGSLNRVPAGQTCDTEGHENVLATHRVTGDCDSFGAEYHDMCQTCYEEYRASISENPNIGCCDWCKATNVPLRPKRDPEEGSCGRVYYVCHRC